MNWVCMDWFFIRQPQNCLVFQFINKVKSPPPLRRTLCSCAHRADIRQGQMKTLKWNVCMTATLSKCPRTHWSSNTLSTCPIKYIHMSLIRFYILKGELESFTKIGRDINRFRRNISPFYTWFYCTDTVNNTFPVLIRLLTISGSILLEKFLLNCYPAIVQTPNDHWNKYDQHLLCSY